MIDDLVIMAIWSIASALFGAMIAFALKRWAAEWKRTTRTFVATIASTFPVVGIAGFALARLGDLPLSVLSMSPEEFLFPFGLQIVLILALYAPRRSRDNPFRLANSFERQPWGTSQTFFQLCGGRLRSRRSVRCCFPDPAPLAHFEPVA